ncbi:MAG: endonuclease/exonuclease/phosphatase family protein [Clostridia bacterium]|nr:endonuclease/exonuclease/phosphatase family protein [Clostridia bacterium]
MKTMKKPIKIALSVIAILLAIITVWGGLMFWYYPHYKNSKTALVLNEIVNENEINVMSCNLRCINPMDKGKNTWFYRADLIIKAIEKEQPGIIGFQEATKWQYKYLCDTMAGYDSIITYRDTAFNTEGCPVFYRTDLYTLINKGSFWLSETPDEMSKGWDAACYRICSYAILKDNATEKEFVVFNTHLDHVSDTARINGIQVVLDKIAEFGSIPAVLMGDLNAEEDSETYRSATANFLDAKYQTENTMTGCTYQNFGKELDSNCIDYVMISKNSFKVNSYKIVNETYDGVYISDHFPLSVSLSFE